MCWWRFIPVMYVHLFIKQSTCIHPWSDKERLLGILHSQDKYARNPVFVEIEVLMQYNVKFPGFR